MSYTYLLEQGGESSAECFSDIPQYVLSRLNLTVAKSSCSDNEMEYCLSSQSGTISEHSMVDRGEDLLMLCVEDSRVRTSALLNIGQKGSKAIGQDYGQKWQGSFARYDQDVSLWKIHQHSLFGGLEEFLGTWPQWGLMRGGECWELTKSAQITNVAGYGFSHTHTHTWPTPCATDYKGSGRSGKLRDRLDYAVERGATKSKSWPTPRTKGMCGGSGAWKQLNEMTTAEEARLMGAGNGGKLNPNWVEWLMGWPIGWTDLKPLEMDKFQQWLQWHSEYSQEGNK